MVFTRKFWAVNCLLLVTLQSLRADAQISYAEAPGDATTTIIKLTVTPAAEPVPAFKHHFVAEDLDLKTGNAAPYYYRTLLDLPRRMEIVRKRFDESDIDKWYQTGVDALPLEQLPVDKMRDAVDSSIGGWVWDQLNEASLRRECNFELGISEIRGVELIYLSLEEFQRSREICRLLAMKTRLEIAEGRNDAAVDTIRMNYRLAQNFGSLPFIVSALIGIAEAGVANGTTLELIAQPNSPNLYWALTELPEPFIDMREAIRFELDFGRRMFPLLKDASTTDRSHGEWNRQFGRLFADLQETGADASFVGGPAPIDGNISSAMMATGAALLGYSHAKQRLIESGIDRDQVEAMAVGQVMAVYTERSYQTLADSFEKAWYLPYQDARTYNEQVENEVSRIGPLSGNASREVIPLVSLLMPAMQAARSADVRMQREMASLRVIEALRMYAAGHGGKLPKSLDEVKEVPVPVNPATGKAFVYQLVEDTAVLQLPASDGVISGNREYEIRIAR